MGGNGASHSEATASATSKPGCRGWYENSTKTKKPYISVGFFLSPCAMENNLIQIEKGKYTALLRRILGMQMSENGVPEMQAILTKMGNLADGARHAYEYGGTIDEIEDNIESIEFALEYYHLRKDDLRAPLIKEAGKIDLRKSVVERDCDDCV